MIELKNITKTYRVRKRSAGMKNAFKTFFKKDYEVIKALDDISFEINEGEMVGYIGPNGAGKSTTIKIMAGILTPDSGQANISGLIPWKQRTKYVKDIGVVFGNRSGLWWDVPVDDSFELLKNIYKIPDDVYKQQKTKLVKLLDIGEIIKIPTRQLSLGQRMRCEIASAFLHKPKIVFLDEPTIGLDAVSKIAVREFIKKINKEDKTTIILTTHDTQDIEALTNRIILIGKGKILLDGKLSDLKKKFSKKYLTVEFNGDIDQLCDGLIFIEKYKGRIIIELNENILTLAKAIAFLTSKIEILDLEVDNTSVDDIVVKLYQEYGI
ncbi:MAG: ATP-binding cassette domain-containing protein [Clostridia bacterium]|nr:ATP-binding cassette domain-containing protein [Clostridia bacterium]MDD4387058.1 ATP-binding cassette domain-containing protein [Clostridia bacterium]